MFIGYIIKQEAILLLSRSILSISCFSSECINTVVDESISQISFRTQKNQTERSVLRRVVHLSQSAKDKECESVRFSLICAILIKIKNKLLTGKTSPPWRIEIVMLCLWKFPGSDFQVFVNSRTCGSSAKLNPLNQLTNQSEYFILSVVTLITQ